MIDWITHSDCKLDGEIVFDNTCIPVRHIVELIKKGITREQLRDNYKKVTEDMLDYAFLIASRY